ncbi:MAG: hypothetical protein KC496_13590 [Anaerolineae bacterium]|nr:hypothetical protein [Anaerolineae bacterium]
MQHMYTASQLRQIHEERIAPYINPVKVAKSKKSPRKTGTWSFNLLRQMRKATQI